VFAVFSVGGGFDREPGPGFFVPALRTAFYPAGKCGAKKGGVDDLGKLPCNFDLLISSGRGRGFALLCLTALACGETAAQKGRL
jgi:hypothetical protein